MCGGMGIEGYARWLFEQYPDCFTVSSLSVSLCLSLTHSLPLCAFRRHHRTSRGRSTISTWT